MAERTRGQRVVHDLNRLKRRRNNWDWHWQQAADLVLPSRQFSVTRERGGRRRDRIYDDTAANAAIRLSSGLHGLFVNPTITWMHLVHPEIEINRLPEMRLWLEDVTHRMLHLFNSPDTNFATAIAELWLEEVTFGTGIMQINDRNRDTTIRFHARALQNTYIEEDSNEQITRVHRTYKISVAELIEQGYEVSDDAMRSMGTNDEHEIDVVHAIMRNMERDPHNMTPSNMPWSSMFVEVDTGHILDEGGFQRNPYLTPRWAKSPDETYGRGPGIDTLPSNKMLQEMMFTVIRGAQKAVDPPINVPATGFEKSKFSANPGAVNFFKVGTNDFPKPLITGVDPRIGYETVEFHRNEVREGFFLDLFDVPQTDRMTATEYLGRIQRNLMTMSPILSRQYVELLSPLVERTFGFMLERGQIPDPPAVFEGDPRLDVEYRSPLAIAQRAADSQNLLQALTLAEPVVSADPTVLDNIDGDSTVRGIFNMFNVSERFLRSEEEVTAVRQSRAQQEQALQQAQIAQTSAAAAADGAQALKLVTEARSA